MKKVLLVILIAVLAACAVMLTACNRDSDRIDEDSEIVSVTVTAKDGYKFELNSDQIAFVADEIMRAGEFEKDVKTSVVGWEFEYDYKFSFKVLVKKFLFKKEEKTLTYALGTTKTRTDIMDEQHKGYYKEEWTNFSTMTGSRTIAESTEEGAAAVYELLEGIIAAERQQKFDAMKAQFVAEGFELRELTQDELNGMYVSDEYLFIGAQQGFEATRESTGESYEIFYTTVDKAKDVYGVFHGKDCRYNDVFVGCGAIPQADSILDRVFASD